ncbi:MAG: hypothetical protein ABSB00_01500 [Minisyncoccia bacterium]|jgi:hypothetical protein
MEPAADKDEIIKRLHRLHADHRRMGIIYGVAIIIVTLTVTYFVLFMPNFQMTFSSQSSVLRVYPPGIQSKSAAASSTSTWP